MSHQPKKPKMMSPYLADGLLPPAPVKQYLSRREIQEASYTIKMFVERRFISDLHMFKHTAPLAFKSGSGVNDDLDGSVSKRPVAFHVPNLHIARGIKVDTSNMVETDGFDAEVVQSLAKWKRIMLQWYDMPVGEGLFCESTSIRAGYFGDVSHSSIVSQWDWEVRLTHAQRTLDTLKKYVNTIYAIIKDAEGMIRDKYPQLKELQALPDTVHFITAEELHATWPDEGIHGREDKAVNKWGAIFIVGMGWPMADGSAPEEVRAPDYDDWSMNGDIIVRHPLTGYRHELSSMGVRVNADSIMKQLEHREMLDRKDLPYHRAVVGEQLPQCIGGGVGICRLLMLLLGTNHIGQVQVGIWADRHMQQCREYGVDLIPNQ